MFLPEQAMFSFALTLANLDVVQAIEKNLSPGQLQAMIAASKFDAFQEAAENGHFDVLRYLEAKAPDQLQAMIAAGDFDAFRRAVEGGHLEVLRYLDVKAPDQLQAMIAAEDFGAFKKAAVRGLLTS